MKPTRRSQPYRKGRNTPASIARANMKRGRTVYGHHPLDMQRLASKRAARMRRRKRRVRRTA